MIVGKCKCLLLLDLLDEEDNQRMKGLKRKWLEERMMKLRDFLCQELQLQKSMVDHIKNQVICQENTIRKIIITLVPLVR